ncbi:MAG: hypothetical protein JW836_08335 [Deltaproteobacteria bacterium]|nr:hypothetical protein [Deltaproteobacteria bacterium]
MLQIDQLSKDQVHSVMLELLYSLNYMWFLMEDWIKNNCPEKVGREDFLNLSQQFGRFEAKRLEKTIQGKPEGVDRLIRFLKHSHWCAFEQIEITKVSDIAMRMRTLNCTAQRAAKKWGMECYECGPGGLKIRSGFFGWIDPRARVTRVFTPPQEAGEGIPPNVSCEWLVSIE